MFKQASELRLTRVSHLWIKKGTVGRKLRDGERLLLYQGGGSGRVIVNMAPPSSLLLTEIVP